MYLLLRNVMLSFVIFWIYLLNDSSSTLNRRILLISLEHPTVYDADLKLARLLNITSRRPGRADPLHYVHIWLEYFKPLGNSSEIIITIHEFLSNEYRPTFVMFKLKFCDFARHFLIATNNYYTSNISIPITPWDFKSGSGCFLKAGVYYFANISLPVKSLSESFPFEKGRAFVNHTYNGKLVMAGFIDLQLKTMPLRKYKGRP